MHKTVLPHFRLLTLLASGQLVLWSSGFSDSTDVFPLRRGLHYVYQYGEDSWGWSIGSYGSHKDSGTVEYCVVDSSITNDTTLIWSVFQKRNFTHRVHSSLPPYDTIYTVSDSTRISLYEFTTGHHRLYTSSPFSNPPVVIWNFPVRFASETYLVFRFSDSVGVQLKLRSYPCTAWAYPNNYDSLWFSSDSGLCRRLSSRCEDHELWGSIYWRTSKLLSRTLTSVGATKELPTVPALLQNYPNPFNPTTTIKYQIPSTNHVLLKVFDILGREVSTLVNESKVSGEYEVQWNASDMPSGVYFYRLITAGNVQTRKMIVQK